jgi:iron(III) transport system ATP-binding protein
MHDGGAAVGTPWTSRHLSGDFRRQQQLLAGGAGRAGQPLVLGQSLAVPKCVTEGANGLVASIRPEKIVVNEALSEPGLHFGGVVRQAMFTGRELQLTIEVTGHGLIEALTEPSAVMIALKPGDAVRLGVRAEDFLFFAPGVSGALLQ